MGKTLIVTSHILPELSRICNVVAIITHGKLRAFGSLDHIMKQVSQRRVFEVQLLGSENCERTAGIIRQQLGEDANVTVSPAEAMVRFESTVKEEDTARLLTALASANVGVAQFRELVQDLEDAFLSVTRNDKLGSGDRESA